MVEYHEQHLFATRAAPRVLPLAAAAATVVLVALFLWIPVAGAAAEQQRIIVGNNTTSLCNVDGNNAAKGGGGGGGEEEDGGCLSLMTIAYAQPQLEGFDMASDLGSSASFIQKITPVTPRTQNPGKAVCGKYKGGRYIPCTTDPSHKRCPQKYNTFTRAVC